MYPLLPLQPPCNVCATSLQLLQYTDPETTRTTRGVTPQASTIDDSDAWAGAVAL